MLLLRDLERLEEQADRSLRRVSEGKSIALPLDCWWPRDWEAALHRRTWGSFCGCQQVEHESAAQKADSIQRCLWKSVDIRSMPAGDDPSFPPGTSGAPCAQLPSTKNLTFKTWQDNLLYLTLIELGIGPENHQRCLPASTFLWVCEVCFLPVKWAGVYFGQKQVIESYLKQI